MICELCPRMCMATREESQGGGVCGMPALPVAARAALHHWEEPCLSGTRGAGTIFFSGCSLGCVFCQNGSISQGRHGKPIGEAQLYQLFAQLAEQGAHNIELVTPTHFAHVLERVLEKPVPGGLPVVWNCSGYERVETLRHLEGKVDIYLPDLKYLSSHRAARYSRAPDYPQVATAAILEMYRQRGPVRFEGELLRSGVMIRHLLLPGGLVEAKAVMDWVAQHFPAGAVLFSLMAQYTPMGDLSTVPELKRPLRPSEVRAANQYMADLGLTGYVQDLAAAEEGFIPAFDGTGL